MKSGLKDCSWCSLERGKTTSSTALVSKHYGKASSWLQIA